MKTMEVKHLLQRYFEGETTVQEERELEAYFNSGDVADELKEYSGFFSGISELAEVAGEDTIEEDVMEFITMNDPAEKPKRRWLWQSVSGIAASVIIVVGSFLFFQKQEEHFTDTFDDPEVAYAYAEQTLSFVSAKYNQGLAALSNFDKLQTAAEPLQQGVQPINEYLKMVERMNIKHDMNQ
jgi:hypothetical protein